MTDKDDILIKQFMQTHKQVIPDNGFTEQVMHHLPADSPVALSKRWTMLCCSLMVAVALTLLFTGNLNISLKMPELIGNMFKVLQSPRNVSLFLIEHLRYGILTWLVLLAGAFKFAYEQFKSA